MPDTLSQLLTPQQVSDILGITTKTLSIWRSSKRYDLPYIKSGRLVRYKREAVQSFIDSREQEGRSADADKF